jgi:hypothetical protein
MYENMDDYSGRAESFLNYLISCDINGSSFNLQFIKSGLLSGEVKFQNKATAELFEGKFAINYEHKSNRIIIVILIINAVFERTIKHRFLPQSMFIADTENFYEELSYISEINKKI